MLGVGSFHYQVLPFPQSQIKLEYWISYFPKFLPVLSDYQLFGPISSENHTTYFLFFTRKDMFLKKNQFITPASYTFIFWKFPFPIRNTLIFNFQNRTNMHKSYAYQISILVALKKTCKSTTWPPKKNQHK